MARSECDPSPFVCWVGGYRLEDAKVIIAFQVEQVVLRLVNICQKSQRHGGSLLRILAHVQRDVFEDLLVIDELIEEHQEQWVESREVRVSLLQIWRMR